MSTDANPAPDSQEETVERMVKELMGGVARFGDFEGALGASAVLTFTNRFLQTLVTLSPTKEDREKNAARMCAALRHMAGVIEFEARDMAKETVH